MNNDKTIKKIHKNIKNKSKILPLAILGIIVVLVISLFIYSLSFFASSQKRGNKIGEDLGRLAGHAVGSFYGLTEGQHEGFTAGHEDALSAEDTSVEISSKIRELSALEVLLASGTFSDILKIGGNVDYAALLSMKYNAIFMVDLSTADIQQKGNILEITLSQPTVEFIPASDLGIDEEYFAPHLLNIIDEYGNSVDGYTAAQNSINRFQEYAQEKLQNDTNLMDAARTSAISQVENLVKAVSINQYQVQVHF